MNTDSDLSVFGDLDVPTFLLPGTRLAGFELGDVLGWGAFAVVYKARRLSDDLPVALKVLRPEVVGRKPALVRRFLREAQIVAILRHPNIVTSVSSGRAETGVPYLATEQAPGRPVDAILHDGGALDPQLAIAIAKQVVDALEHAHDCGIIHRDIKPANIMVDGEGDDLQVKILDFGIGKVVAETAAIDISEDLSLQQPGFGNPRYVAPEVFSGEDVGPETDVYGVGLLLFEMLTGKPLVTGATIHDVINNVFAREALMPAPWHGTPLGDLVEKACSTRRSDRYADMEILASALADVELDGEPEPQAEVSAAGEPAQAPAEPLTQPVTVAEKAAVEPAPAEVVPEDKPDALATEPEVAPLDERTRAGLTGRSWMAIFASGAVICLGAVAVLAGVMFLNADAYDPVLESAIDAAQIAVDDSIEGAVPQPEPEPDVEFRRVVLEGPKIPNVVTIRVESHPTGAAVVRDGEILCEPTPCEVELDETDDPVELILRRSGYRDAAIELVPQENETLKARLRK